MKQGSNYNNYTALENIYNINVQRLELFDLASILIIADTVLVLLFMHVIR